MSPGTRAGCGAAALPVPGTAEETPFVIMGFASLVDRNATLIGARMSFPP